MRPEVRCTPRWRSQPSSLRKPSNTKEEEMSRLRKFTSVIPCFLFSGAEWETCLAQKCCWDRDAALSPEEAGAYWITASLQLLLPHGGAGKPARTVCAPPEPLCDEDDATSGIYWKKKNNIFQPIYIHILTWDGAKAVLSSVSDNQPSESFHVSIS